MAVERRGEQEGAVVAGGVDGYAPSISPFLFAQVVGWLAVIFLSYAVFAPRNAMAAIAMGASALSVFGALVMVWQLDRPFDGFMPVSSEPMRIATEGVGNAKPSP